MSRHRKKQSKLYLLAVLLVAVVLISGCSQGQQTTSGLGNGVAVLEFKSNQEGAQLRANEPIQFVAKIQNQGTVSAKNLRANIVELEDKDKWQGLAEQNLGDLLGYNQEQKLAGPVRTVTFSTRTPQVAVTKSFPSKLSVRYDNTLKGTGTITLVDTDTFIQRRDAGQGLVSEFGVADVGPLDIRMTVPEIRTQTTGNTQDLIVPVQITVVDKTGNPINAHVFGGQGSIVSNPDYTYPVRVNIKWPSRLTLDTRGADPLCQSGQTINLNNGKSYDTTCILKVTNPPQRGAAAEKVSFEVELQYTYEVLQSLAQPLSVLKSGG